jgi:chromosome segregation ATPase
MILADGWDYIGHLATVLGGLLALGGLAEGLRRLVRSIHRAFATWDDTLRLIGLVREELGTDGGGLRETLANLEQKVDSLIASHQLSSEERATLLAKLGELEDAVHELAESKDDIIDRIRALESHLTAQDSGLTR